MSTAPARSFLPPAVMPAVPDAPLSASSQRLQTGFEHPHFVSPWHAHLVAQNPYPLPPPPPPVAHKVWLIDCRTCGTFLTNRGMKVRPPLTSRCSR